MLATADDIIPGRQNCCCDSRVLLASATDYMGYAIGCRLPDRSTEKEADKLPASALRDSAFAEASADRCSLGGGWSARSRRRPDEGGQGGCLRCLHEV